MTTGRINQITTSTLSEVQKDLVCLVVDLHKTSYYSQTSYGPYPFAPSEFLTPHSVRLRLTSVAREEVTVGQSQS
jgi:hypothetical protein